MARHSDLRIGTSGWSYPTGEGTWNGIFYPSHRPRAARGKAGSKAGARGKFDELAYYAEHFDTVEINSSFYGVPTVQTTSGWAARTPKNFEFSLKLYQKFTHPKMFKEIALKRTPGTPSSDATLDALAAINQSDVDDFKRAMDPLASTGKLGALLAQFPSSFKADAPSIDYLGWLLKTFRDYHVAVELRHRSWSDDLKGTLDLLNGAKAAYVQIDEPKFRQSIRQNFLPNVTGFYYLRLHGRNAKDWWKPAKSEDRYNYLYSQEELDPFVEVADAVRSLVKKMYLYTNNHFAGKAVANAVMLKQRLGLPVEGEYPEEFAERYPEARGVVRVASPEPAARPQPSDPAAEGESAPARAKSGRGRAKSAPSGSLF
jgi:uncharacterized protein YecE (DUF72 family)